MAEIASTRLGASDIHRQQLLLADVEDPEVLARVGKGLVDGASGAELANMVAE